MNRVPSSLEASTMGTNDDAYVLISYEIAKIYAEWEAAVAAIGPERLDMGNLGVDVEATRTG